MPSVNAQKRIGIAALIWGASMMLSRAIGVIRESVIGRTLGDSPEADAYWAAFALPGFLQYMLAGGALSMVFIPMFSRYLEKNDAEGGWRLFSILFTTLSVILAVVVPTFIFITPWVSSLAVPGFEGEKLEIWIRLTRIMLPAQIFHILGGLLSAVLMAKDKHALPAFANLGYSGGIIVFGIALGPRLGPEAFAWGVLVGSIVGPFGLPLIGCLREGLLHFRPRIDFAHPDFRRYLWLTLPIAVAFSVVVVDDWLIARFGSVLEEGVISRLTYAKTLMKVPMGIFGLAVASAAYPTLSRQVNEGMPATAYDTLMRSCRQMLVLAFASQAAFTVAGADVAEVIWGTARFTPAELNEIGLYTGLFCLGLGAWAANSILARGFYAQQKTWIPSLAGSGIILLLYPLYAWLASSYGGPGLGMASSIAITLYTVILAVLLRRTMAGPDADNLWTLLIRMVPAVLLATGAGWGLDQFIDQQGGLPALLQGALTGSLALGLTLILARIFGVPEVSEITAKVWGKVRSKLPA
jgi:putative peptidoglycan lipid II flippase